MAATKSDLSEEDGWTPLRELVLLDCLEQFPPFGKDRHFHIVSLCFALQEVYVL